MLVAHNEKFFFDKGVLFHYLYGFLADVMAVRFILKKKSFMCKEVNPKKSFDKMNDFVIKNTNGVKEKNLISDIRRDYAYVSSFYTSK